MRLKVLKANKRNPRKITSSRLEALRKSLEKFGDLSGIVVNRRTGNIVSGHQRQKALPDASIKIEKKFETPTRCFTVAEGYVEIDGERFKYREVDAPEEWEVEALLAANNQGGSNDEGMLKIVLADFPALDLELAGLPELKPLAPLRESSSFNAPSGAYEESDEEYVANTPQTTESIDVERIPSTDNVSPFDKVVEKSEVAGKRYVLIIDCSNEEAKQGLKEKIRAEVEMAGAKFF